MVADDDMPIVVTFEVLAAVPLVEELKDALALRRSVNHTLAAHIAVLTSLLLCTLLTIFNHPLAAHIAVLTSLLLTALFSLYSTIHLMLTSLSSHHPFSLHFTHYIQPYT